MIVSGAMDICIPKNGLHSCKSEGRLRFKAKVGLLERMQRLHSPKP